MKFSDYYERAKKQILENVDTVFEFNTTHSLNRYCKLPVVSEDEKVYVSLKINEEIVVTWQRTHESIHPLSIKIGDTVYESQWNPVKTKKWVLTSTKQIIS